MSKAYEKKQIKVKQNNEIKNDYDRLREKFKFNLNVNLSENEANINSKNKDFKHSSHLAYFSSFNSTNYKNFYNAKSIEIKDENLSLDEKIKDTILTDDTINNEIENPKLTENIAFHKAFANLSESSMDEIYWKNEEKCLKDFENSHESKENSK